MAQQLNVVELGRRRRWSEDEKLRIVMEIRMALENAGIIFIPANGEDVGVRLRRDRKVEP